MSGLSGAAALEALLAAIDEARAGRPAWIPGRGSTVDHSGFADVDAVTLRSLPGVTVLAEGAHGEFGSPVLLITVRGERWVATTNESTLLFPGDRWDDLVTSGKVLSFP